MTKEEVIKKINELDIERVKLFGRLEQIQDQEKEVKLTDQPAK